MDYRGLLNMHPKPLTTPNRYGAGMAHTTVSIGFINYCRLSCTVWRITVDYGPWWTIMDCHGRWTIMCYYGFLWILDDHDLINILEYHGIIMNSGQSWYIMDYRGLWTIMDYLGLSWTIVDYLIFSQYHGWWIIVDYPGLAWIIVDYCKWSRLLWIMDSHGSRDFCRELLPIFELYFGADFLSYFFNRQRHPPESMRRCFNKMNSKSRTFGEGMTQ